jgi:hypothetical protein
LSKDCLNFLSQSSELLESQLWFSDNTIFIWVNDVKESTNYFHAII